MCQLIARMTYLSAPFLKCPAEQQLLIWKGPQQQNLSFLVFSSYRISFASYSLHLKQLKRELPCPYNLPENNALIQLFAPIRARLSNNNNGLERNQPLIRVLAFPGADTHRIRTSGARQLSSSNIRPALWGTARRLISRTSSSRCWSCQAGFTHITPEGLQIFSYHASHTIILYLLLWSSPARSTDKPFHLHFSWED